MRPEDFADSPTGRVVPLAGGACAYVPHPLPEEIAFDQRLVASLDRASRSLSVLAGIGETLPDVGLLVRPFLRREAVLSSRIEGTQASLTDLFAYEAAGRSDVADSAEVANYVRALDRGHGLLSELPLVMRTVHQVHGVLMDGVRGHDRRPGELRDRQVWIGRAGTPMTAARFVPPPPSMLPDLLRDWERFVNADMDMPPLVQCALMHYQFETIHPYLDGNGRVGRLLITLFLIARGVLPAPLLYLSASFERRRTEYYDHLLAVSRGGDWRPWLEFFLEGVREQADDALARSRMLRTLHEEYRLRLQEQRETANAFVLLDELFARPIVSRSQVAEVLSMTAAGARRILDRFERAGIVVPLEGTWPQLFAATEVLELLEAPS
ncbi:MAG: Fic family protein [Dehalococcoidia bacterium]|nr:Fic family protein [Dehalococcoidia bacterium]